MGDNPSLIGAFQEAGDFWFQLDDVRLKEKAK